MMVIDDGVAVAANVVVCMEDDGGCWLMMVGFDGETERGVCMYTYSL